MGEMNNNFTYSESANRNNEPKSSFNNNGGEFRDTTNASERQEENGNMIDELRGNTLRITKKMKEIEEQRRRLEMQYQKQVLRTPCECLNMSRRRSWRGIDEGSRGIRIPSLSSSNSSGTISPPNLTRPEFYTPSVPGTMYSRFHATPGVRRSSLLPPVSMDLSEDDSSNWQFIMYI